MTNILVVCTANICRSPMGEALLRQRIVRAGLADEWQVQSAGTWAMMGHAASDFSVAEMADRGLDIRAHRSQPVTRDLLERTEAVLVMTRSHREALQAEFPEYAHKVFLFSELGGSTYDIVDPAGGLREDYAACAHELEGLIDKGFAWLEEVVRNQ